jgi:hypothetical protein
MTGDRGLDQQATQQVLERALELDVAAGEQLKPEQIRSIAAELGISAEAIEQALVEHASALAAGSTSASQPVRRPARWFARVGTAVAIATALFVAVALVARLVS